MHGVILTVLLHALRVYTHERKYDRQTFVGYSRLAAESWY